MKWLLAVIVACMLSLAYTESADAHGGGVFVQGGGCGVQRRVFIAPQRRVFIAPQRRVFIGGGHGFNNRVFVNRGFGRRVFVGPRIGFGFGFGF